MWLARFSDEFLLSQPKLNKKFGWGSSKHWDRSRICNWLRGKMPVWLKK